MGMVTETLLMPRRRTKAEYTPFGQMIDDLQGDRTDEDLGKEAEISRNQVYLIKTGKSGTTQNTIKNLAVALGLVNRETLIKFYALAGYAPPGDVVPPSPPELSYEMTDEEKEEILSAFAGRAPQLRHAALNSVKALLDSLPDPDAGQPIGKRRHDD